MFDRIHYTLLQVRNPSDPMRQHEVECFARVLSTTPRMISVLDLISGQPSARDFAKTDMFLFGGSGHYSAAGESEWLERTLDVLRDIHRLRKPTFGSCWGFQALARAMGGRVIHDPDRAEVGTHDLWLTEAGRHDPVFGPLGEAFSGQMGHEDCVVELPPGTTLLASSARVENQAYRFDDQPIYCTQFHPELSRHDLLARVATYPEYIERILGVPIDEFCKTLRETPETEVILNRFVAMVFGN